MNKKLPEIFQNKIEKTLTNNDNMYYSAKEQHKEIVDNRSEEKSIREKINEIFSSPNYIYKANVKITIGNQTINTRIIGRNKNYLITMDNKTFLIDDITNIEIDQSNKN